MTARGARAARSGIPDLAGRVAVVTGAAHGIGRALAGALHARGCRLALVDVDAAPLAALRDELAASDPARAPTAHVVDVGDRARMRQLADDVLRSHGAVHVLVNNAGVAHEAPFVRTSLEDWDRVLAVNLMGVVHGCHVFLPHLARADRAHVVNLSSLLGVVAMPGQCAYAASKFAVRGLSESLREELRGTTVGLTVVHPGAVATGIMRRARGDDPALLHHVDRWYARHAMPPARVAARIVRAIERGTPRLVIGPDARLADLLKRLLPVAGNALFVRAAIRMLGVGHVRIDRRRQWDALVAAGAASDAGEDGAP